MGSPCELLVDCERETDANTLAGIVSTEAWRIEDKFSRYLPDNIVHRINNSDGKSTSVDDETANLLDFSARPGYATDRVNRAKGDAALFNELLQAYLRAPEVTRRRIYLETMQDVLPKVEKMVVLDSDLKGVLPLLSLEGGQKP